MKKLTIVVSLIALACFWDSECKADIMSWNVAVDDGPFMNNDSSSMFPNTGLLDLGGFELTAAYDSVSSLLTLTYDDDFTGVPVGWAFGITGFTTGPGETVTAVTALSAAGASIGSIMGGTDFTIDTPAAIAGTDFTFNVTTSASAAVPEPSSVAMLCALGLGGAWVRRRRQSVA